MHGTMVQISLPEIIDVPFSEIIFRDIRIVGSVASSSKETKSMLQTIAKHDMMVNMIPFQGHDKIGDLTKLVH